MATSTTPTIAVVGASFGGLAFASALQQKLQQKTTVLFLESQTTETGSVYGDLHLPSGEQSLHQLGMTSIWNRLTKQSGCKDHVSQEDLKQAMRQQVGSDRIRYGHRVLSVDIRGFVQCLVNDKGLVKMGPFDLVVAADGVRSPFRHCVQGCRVALVGDARWVQDRFDLGTTRIHCGADIAIREGIELARLLVNANIRSCRLGKFCARRKNLEIRTRRAIFFFLVVGTVSLRFLSLRSEQPSRFSVLAIFVLFYLGWKYVFESKRKAI